MVLVDGSASVPREEYADALTFSSQLVGTLATSSSTKYVCAGRCYCARHDARGACCVMGSWGHAHQDVGGAKPPNLTRPLARTRHWKIRAKAVMWTMPTRSLEATRQHPSTHTHTHTHTSREGEHRQLMACARLPAVMLRDNMLGSCHPAVALINNCIRSPDLEPLNLKSLHHPPP